MNNYVEGKLQVLIEKKELMKPLWIVFPEYCQYSMAWRMGGGEDYADKFRKWFSQFSAEEKEVYRNLFPTPVGWYGWWSDADDFVEDPTFYSKGDLFTGDWRPTGRNIYTAEWLNNKLRENTSVNIITCENSATSRMLPSGWGKTRFCAPAGEPESTFFSVMEFVLECQSLYFSDELLSELIYRAFDEPEEWSVLNLKIQSYTDEEWEALLPGLLAIGFYYQISQDEKLLKYVLASHDTNVYVVNDPKDRLLCGCLAKDKSMLDGKNLLGFALMNARDEIYKIYENVGLCDCFGK